MAACFLSSHFRASTPKRLDQFDSKVLPSEVAANPRLGIESTLSAFDPRLNVCGGTRLFRQDLNADQTQCSKKIDEPSMAEFVFDYDASVAEDIARRAKLKREGDRKDARPAARCPPPTD